MNIVLRRFQHIFKNNIGLMVITVLSVIAILPLFHNGLHPTHDGEYHIIRFYEFDKTIRNGDWYPRWAPDLNNAHGIPLFTYVYPLPNYVAFLLHLTGMSFIDSFKFELVITEVLGTLFFFLWAKKWWGQTGGLVAAVCFAYSPYHFVDIYVRGSIGEAWALCFFPLVLFLITKSLTAHGIYIPTLTGIALALTIFSHNILGLMFFAFYLCYSGLLVLFAKEKRKFILQIIYTVFLALCLSAIFWIPALLEAKYVRGLQIYDIKNNFPDFYELIFPSWGWGFMQNDLSNHMSYQIGLLNVAAVCFSVILLLKKKYKHAVNKKLILFFLLAFLFIVVLMNHISLPFWQVMPIVNNFQFPWRFLSLIIIITSFLAGAITFFYPKISVPVFILLALLLTAKYNQPPYFMHRDDAYYTTKANFVSGTNSPGNVFQTVWMTNVPSERHRKLIIPPEKGTIVEQSIKPTRYSFMIINKLKQRLVLYSTFFPGWQMKMDNYEIPILPTRDGYISFILPSGLHNLTIRFGNTLIENVSMGISCLAIFIVFCVTIAYVRIKK